MFLAWHGFQDGFSRLKQLLELALALENLDYEWEELRPAVEGTYAEYPGMVILTDLLNMEGYDITW